MKTVLIGLGVLLASSILNVSSVHADTTCKMTKATAAGTGPYTISAEGTVSISTGESFGGVQYQILELAPGGQTYVGFVNLPNGAPTAGGAAVKITGTNFPFPRKGDYRVFFTIIYSDNKGMPQKLSASKDVTVN